LTPPRHFLRKILILRMLGVDLKCKVLIPEDLLGKYLESVSCEESRKGVSDQRQAARPSYELNPIYLFYEIGPN
jgi:hypothetical protein